MEQAISFHLSAQQILNYRKRGVVTPESTKVAFDIAPGYRPAEVYDALATVTDRHDALRASFTFRAGVDFPFVTVDPPQGRQNKCFSGGELHVDNPLTIAVTPGATGGQVVQVAFTPLLLDVCSVDRVRKEVAALLAGVGQPAGSEEVIQLGSYTSWEAALLEEADPEARAFWSKTFAGAIAPPRAGRASVQPGCIRFTCDGRAAGALADQWGIAEKSLLIALFGQSVARWANLAPLTIASLENGRVYDELKPTLGPLSRLYPVPFAGVYLDRLDALARGVEDHLSACRNWNDYYYAAATAASLQEAGQVVFEWVPDEGEPPAAGPLRVEDALPGCQLRLRLYASGGRYTAELAWEASFMDPEGAERLREDLQSRLQTPGIALLHVHVGDRALIKAFNDTGRGRAEAATVPHLLKQVFGTCPDQVAISGTHTRITYRQLEAQVKSVAYALIHAHGVEAGDRVGILMRNDTLVPAALLGVMFAGAAYVPMNEEDPSGRTAMIAGESQCKLILTDALVPEPAGDFPFPPLVPLEGLLLTGHPPYELACSDPSDTVYLIFTSGTTGKPKGCQLLHRNLAHYVQWANGYYFGAAGEGNFALLTKLSFDLTVTSLFTTLTRGRTLHCLPGALSLPEKLAYCFSNDNGIDAIKITPTHVLLLANCGIRDARLKCAIIGGEELLPSHVKILRQLAPHVNVYNEYGPTEATVGCTVKHVSGADGPITIGRPIANMEALVLSEGQQLLPVGVAGELYLAGDGIAPGYWGQPALTEAKFIALPQFDHARYYRTGDRACLLPQGELAYLGRLDDQVKIRGNRVEPGEVNALLAGFDAVEQAFAVARNSPAGETHLVAYYLADKEIPGERFRAYLAARLPDYMVPGFFIRITEVPCTAHGKLDAGRLPDPFAGKMKATVPYVAPGHETEIKIAGIWQNVLHLEQVGLHDNFFELGGHSLTAMRVVSAMRKELDVEVEITDLFNHPTVGGLARIVQEKEKGLALPLIERFNDKPEKSPLSFSQERLWFIDRLEGTVHYHMPVSLRIKGTLDVAALERALQCIINRHQVLRTVFVEEAGKGYQQVMPPGRFRISAVTDGENLDPEALKKRIAALIAAPFDLSRDHMLRVHLLRTAADEVILVGVMHHIASDGWSFPILIREMHYYYAAETGQDVPPLAELPVQYVDYSHWQRKYLEGALLDKQLDYWAAKLAGAVPLEMPTSYPRPAVQSIRGKTFGFRVEPAVLEGIHGVARQHEVTLYMTLLAAFKVMLYRYSGQTDICVGSPIANRMQKEVDGLIGFFVNVLVLRTELSGNPAFSELLRQVKRTTLEAYEHQEVPFERIVDKVVKERDMTLNPLFQVMLILQNNEDGSHLRFGEAELEPLTFDYEISKFDLTFNLRETRQGLLVDIEYCTDLFAPEAIAQMAAHYRQLLVAVAATPECPVDGLSMLTAGEAHELLVTFNDTAVEYPAGGTVLDLLDGQVEKAPDAIALRFEDQLVTYRGLDEQSDRFARHLAQQYNVGPGDVVAIMMDRSAYLVTAILGVLKAGAAYVPLDVDYPLDRKSFILSDTGAKLLLIESDNLLEVIEFSLPVLPVDLELDDLPAAPAYRDVPDPGDLAYLIYTSGTTGQPKGVMIEHGALCNVSLGFNRVTGLEPGGRMLQFAPFVFDGFCIELFASLAAGATLVVTRKADITSLDRIRRIIAGHGVNFVILPPSYLEVLKDDLGQITTVVSAGEALNPGLTRALRERGIRVMNGYGPTENTVAVAISPEPLRGKGVVTIGRPLGNVRVYLLDGAGNLVPKGVAGELCVGGRQLARGYLNREELTREKFTANPFGPAGDRLYRTGDLARWLPDGNLVHLGRKDNQLKFNGHRIEPGEIEATLEQLNGVKQAAVLLKDDAQGRKMLVGYVVTADGSSLDKLPDYLSGKLPAYMVPARFVALDAMPLTVNGKIDRKALPDPYQTFAEAAEAAAVPGNPTEAVLLGIWKELLQKEQISTRDDFFGLGGHSLLAIKLAAEIKASLKKEVEIRALFIHKTIKELAAHLLTLQESDPGKITAGKRPDLIPLSFPQENFWQVHQYKDRNSYQVPFILELKKDVSVEGVLAAVQAIINRHEVLRTVYREDSGGVHQYVLPRDAWTQYAREPVTGCSEKDLDAMIREEVYRPFDLTADHMVRVRLFEREPEPAILVLVVHHIATDGWSHAIFTHELMHYYRAAVTGQPPSLEALPIQYADYSIWQRNYLAANLENHIRFWKQKLDGVEPFRLPTRGEYPTGAGIAGASHSLVLDRALFEELQHFTREMGVSMYMALLAAFKVMLYQYSGQHDVTVLTSAAGRKQKEVSKLIGFFANQIAVRSNVEGHMTCLELLQQIKSYTLDAYDFQETPFAQVAERIALKPGAAPGALSGITFTMQNNEGVAFDTQRALDDLIAGRRAFVHQYAKYELSFAASEVGDDLIMHLEYNTQLFSRETIQQMAAHYVALLHRIVEYPGQQIASLPAFASKTQYNDIYAN